MRDQQAREDALAASHPTNVIIGDPAALMTAVYSVAYFDDATLLAKGAELAHGYGLLVWCDIDLPWQPDGIQRDGALMQQRVDALLAGLVREELAGARLIRVAGPTPIRVEAVRRAWQQPPLMTPT
jgi:hypothetical protein